MEYDGYGVHLFIDADGIGNLDLLTSRSEALAFTTRIIEIAKMKSVGPPLYYPFPEREESGRPQGLERMPSHYPADLVENLSIPAAPLRYNDDETSVSSKTSFSLASDDDVNPGGYSLVHLLAESHLSVHTYPARCGISFDLFSCCPYDSDAVIEFIKGNLLGASVFKVKVINRTFC